MRIGFAAVLVAAIFGPASAASSSCPTPPGVDAAAAISVGSIRRGSLSPDSSRLPFRLALAGDRAMQVDLESDEFNTRLIVYEREGGRWVQLAEDDDGGNGLNARVQLSGSGAREYLLIAAGTSGTGAFDISVRDRPPPPPPPPARPIRAGDTATGRIAAGTGADHLLQAQGGIVYDIDLRSEDFDTVVEVRRLADPLSTPPLARDDDGGEGNNSRLLFVPPVSGPYRITATSFGEDEGAYRLAVTEARPMPLGPGDHALRLSGAPALFRFEAAPDMAYLIEMKSSTFDSFLEVRAASGAGPVTRDDDGGEGRNARLMFVPQAPGPHLITARALDNGTGDFMLSLTPYRRAGN